MAFAGLRGSGSWGTDERPKNFREGILWLQPNGTAPLTALLAKAAKSSVNDPEFAWWEEKMSQIQVKVNDGTGYTATSTTLTVDTASTTINGGLDLVAGDVLLVERTETSTYDNELMVVSSVTNDTTIVVKRAQAGTTAAGIADDTVLTKIGNAYAEGASTPDISQRNPTKVSNYCQIFRTVYGITKTADVTHARTGDALKNDKKRKMFDHSVAMEMAFLLGVGYEDTTGSFPKRYTKGLRKFITTNVKVYTTSPTEDDFLDQISPIFDYAKDTMAGNERLVLAGNGFLNNLNKLARNSSSTRVNFDGTIKLYGMELQKWVLPQGTLGIKSHPLLSTNARYKNSAFFLDLSNIKYRPLRDTKSEENIQAPGDDSIKGQWITECGLEMNFERTAAYLGNFVI